MGSTSVNALPCCLLHLSQASAATSGLQQTIRDPGKPALPRAAAAGEPQPGGAGPCAEGICDSLGRTTSDELARGSPGDRKTRRADLALRAAPAEPVPGALEQEPGCPSIWEGDLWTRTPLRLSQTASRLQKSPPAHEEPPTGLSLMGSWLLLRGRPSSSETGTR